MRRNNGTRTSQRLAFDCWAEGYNAASFPRKKTSGSLEKGTHRSLRGCRRRPKNANATPSPLASSAIVPGSGTVT